MLAWIGAGIAFLLAVTPMWNPMFGWFFPITGFFVLAAITLGSSASKIAELESLHRRDSDLAKRQLAEQQSAVDSLADGLDVAIFICDGRANIQYANRRASEMFRFERPIGRSVLAVTLSYDLEQLVLETAQASEARDAELSFSYPEERVGLVRAWTADESGQRVFVSVVEISDLRRLERVRTDFVSNVSHELRTPMTLIRAMAETLIDEPKATKEVRDRYLKKIIDEIDRLSTISNDLLILSAAESSPVRKSPCDIGNIVSDVVQQLTAKAKSKGLTLEYSGPSSFVIEANAAQLTQVVLNLVENGLNYTVEGSVSVRLEAVGDDVVLLVADTGIGIASEHLPRIFERFYRVDRARSRSSGGTGLGLSIVKHIVEVHGGNVQVESTLNRGTEFRATIPRGDVSAIDQNEAEAAQGQPPLEGLS